MPLTDLIAEYGVPGAQVAVLADGEVTTEFVGVLSTATREPVRADSPFMIQSVTKVWTATLVMQLVDDGLVGLDDLVADHLPGFRPGHAITVRHLLTHTGGFEGDFWMATTDGDDALQRLVEDHVQHAAQLRPPGTGFSYCSAGMAVLGRLVELHRGTTYAEALRRWLTEPLGVHPVLHDEAPGAAIGHVDGRPLPVWAVMPPSNPPAGNRLAMSARGLLDLGALHLRDGLAPDGTRLLSAGSARLMREPQVAVPATLGPPRTQGLGWQVLADGAVEHSGGAPGNAAWLRVGTERVVAVVANGGDEMGLFTALLGLDRPEPPASAYVEDAERYVGRYALTTQVSEVTVRDGRLWLTRTERGEAAAMTERAGLPVEPQTFELRRVAGDLFARVDAQGRSAGAVVLADGFLDDGRSAPRTHVTLREVTDANRAEVVEVRTTTVQEEYVAPVAASLEEAAATPEASPWFRAVYDGEEPVGFVMLSWDVTPRLPDIRGPWFLWRLLVDHRHQGQGIGREVLRQVVGLIRAEGATELLTSYHVGADSPAGFYAGLGFVPTGELDPDGEVILRLPLDH